MFTKKPSLPQRAGILEYKPIRVNGGVLAPTMIKRPSSTPAQAPAPAPKPADATNSGGK